MPNLCGVNQKLLQQALQQVKTGVASSQKRPSPDKSMDVSSYYYVHACLMPLNGLTKMGEKLGTQKGS